MPRKPKLRKGEPWSPELEEHLRRELMREAGEVEPDPDALAKIRRRIAEVEADKRKNH